MECSFCGLRPTFNRSWRMTEPIALVPINSVRHLTSKENVGCAWF
jgi:hypothetical protein